MLEVRGQTIQQDSWTKRVILPNPNRVMTIPFWVVCVWQDYKNALRIKVRGQATLKLVTDNPAIKMENETREVSVIMMMMM